jgi:hypothetical protein
MLEQIITFIEGLKRNPNISKFDEAKIKQAIILPILQFLNWNIYDVSEVVPEYSVESRRVDYSLRLNDTNEVFIEAKGAGASLEDHEEQLLDYAFRQGVEIAALTNGITWSLYLPTKKGDWKARKFYTIDIIQQESKDAAQKFVDLLSKKNVESGGALQKAESIYKGRLKKVKIEETMPEAWEKIINEPDPLLVDLLAETTEKLCGFKPVVDDVEEFLAIRKSQFIISQEPVPPLVVKKAPGLKSRDILRKKAGRVTLQELAEAGLIRDGQTLFFYHTGQAFKDEKVTVLAKINKVKYERDGKIYSLSELAKILLQKHGYKRDDHQVAGPRYWQTYDGRLLNDLNEQIRAQRGDRK